jgi:nitrite reductase (NADH) small subunit
MKEWRAVASVEELARTGRVVARVGGREIGVVATEAGPRAIRNRCPHHGAPLCLGSVRRRESGTPGRYGPPGDAVLRCPWHGWEFDLESGRCLSDPDLRAAVYPVRAVDGRIEILL